MMGARERVHEKEGKARRSVFSESTAFFECKVLQYSMMINHIYFQVEC